MNMDDLRALVDLMEQNHLVELEYENNGLRVKLRRSIPQDPAPAPAPAAVPAPAAPAVAPAPPAPRTVQFRSPLVGTFYRSPKPDAEPYVDAGDEVGPDTTLCIIEAMKVMNEIKAEGKGRIVEILAKNGQTVEFGEPLFVLEPVE